MTQLPPRRGRLRVRLELALAAFAPAFLLVALRSGGEWWSWVFYALTAIGVIVLIVGAILVATANPDPFEFVEIKDASDEIIGYVGAYIVPVLIDPAASLLNAIVAAIALFLVFTIHVATGRVHVNPLLYLIGYRAYSARTATASYALIARSEVADWTGERSLVNPVSGILVEKWKRTS